MNPRYWDSFYPLKKLKTRVEINDKTLQDGVTKKWYENGVLMFKGYYLNGYPHGVHEGWYENGALKYSQFYVNGNEHGIQFGQYQSGRKEYWHYYEHGILITSARWTESGCIKYKRVYKNGILIYNKESC